MKKTSSMFLIAVLLIAAPAILFAQEPPPGPQHQGPPMHGPAKFAEHRLKMFTEKLALTDDQQKQAATIFNDEATASSKLWNQMKTAHENLRKASKERNATAIDQSAAAIGTLTAQMISTREKGRLAFAKILTPDQLKKLDDFESQREQKHMGPGDWGGPRHQHGKHPGPQHDEAPPAGPGQEM